MPPAGSKLSCLSNAFRLSLQSFTLDSAPGALSELLKGREAQEDSVTVQATVGKSCTGCSSSRYLKQQGQLSADKV